MKNGNHYKLIALLIIVLTLSIMTACNEDSVSYTVSFDSSYGNFSAVSVKDGKTVLDLPVPYRTGYTFDGWYSDSAFSTPFTVDTNVVSNVTLYAKFLVTIAFDTDGASSIPNVQIVEGSTLDLSTVATPAHETLTFMDWYYDAAFTRLVGEHDSFSQSCTLYAKFLYITSEIHTVDDLYAIENNPSGEYFLMNNLDLQGAQLTQLCSSPSTNFSGVLDGRNYTISNFTLSGANGLLGMFGYVNGTIKKLTLSNVTASYSDNRSSIEGGLYCAVLRGRLDTCSVSGTISVNNSHTNANTFVGSFVGSIRETGVVDCFSDATVTATAQGGLLSVGGIAGYNVAVVQDCYYNGTTTANATTAQACSGGLVGYNSGSDATIAYATANGSVVCNAQGGFGYAGGVCGYGYFSENTLLYCASYASVTVTATANNDAIGGGLIGYTDGVVNSGLAVGNVTVTNDSTLSLATAIGGGLIGKAVTSTVTQRSLATGDVFCYSTNNQAGGVFGSSGGLMLDNFRYCGQKLYPMIDYKGNSATVSLLTNPNFYSNTLAWTSIYYDLDEIAEDFADLAVPNTSDSPFEISTKAELLAIPEYAIDYYKLTASIDLGGQEWTPINFVNDGAGLDGGGYSISNFKLTEAAQDVGFIAVNCGNVKFLSLISATVNVSGDMVNVGILIGRNIGTLTSVNAQGTVNATSAKSLNVGGLVGFNFGTINDSYSNTSVSVALDNPVFDSTTFGGGLIGKNGADVKGCCAFGTVNSNSYAGGLCGYDYGKVSTSYCNVAVLVNANGTGYAYAGGLFGYASSSTTSNCYAIGNATSISIARQAYAGGLFGYSKSSTVSFCYSTGVSSSSSQGASYAYAGGLSGRDNGSTYTSCYSQGDVTAISTDETLEFAGRTFGAITSTSVSRCVSLNTTVVTACNEYINSSVTTKDDMTFSYLVSTLGWSNTVWKESNGYYVLTWQ